MVRFEGAESERRHCVCVLEGDSRQLEGKGEEKIFGQELVEEEEEHRDGYSRIWKQTDGGRQQSHRGLWGQF